LCGGEGRECAAYGECEEFDCGRTIKCPKTDTLLYCDVQAHTCHRVDGQCGGSDSKAYSCPELKGLLPLDTSVMCTETPSGVNRCSFQTQPFSPWLGAEVTTNAHFDSPEEWHVFEPTDDLEFGLLGVQHPGFLVVTVGKAEDLEHIQQKAIWAAPVRRPASPADTQSVSWSGGSQIDHDHWSPDPGMPPHDVDLYATLLELEGNVVVSTTPSPLPFRVGQPWATPGSDCSADEGGTPRTCDSPSVILGCFEGTCRKLCLANSDCPSGTGCRLVPETGVRYCN
jgi:hypothetical protein